MRTFFLLVVLLCGAHSFRAQSIGAVAASLCNATSARVDSWAYFSNPGALAYIKENQVAMSYHDRFLLKELQTQALTAAFSLDKGVFSVGAQMYGYDFYRMSRIGLGYSMLLSEKISAGVQFNYHQLRLSQNYGKKNLLTAEVGIVYQLNERLKCGMSVYNLGRAKLSSDPLERTSTRMRIGGSAKMSSVLHVNFDLHKQVEYKPEFRCGLEYKPIPSFSFRGGVAIGVPEMSFGFGYQWKRMQLDIASSYQQRLGWSPVLTFSYLGKTKSE